MGVNLAVPLYFSRSGIRSNSDAQHTAEFSRLEIDSAHYDGVADVRFYANLQNVDSVARTVAVVDNAGNEVTGIEVPANTSAFTTLPSDPVSSLLSGLQGYRLRFDQTSVVSQLVASESWLLIRQIDADISRIQIPVLVGDYDSEARADLIAGYDTTVSATFVLPGAADGTNAPTFDRLDSRYADIVDWTFEAMLRVNFADDATVFASLFRLSDDAQVAASELTTVGDTTVGKLYRASWSSDPNWSDNDQYYVMFRRTASIGSRTGQIRQANVYVRLENLSKADVPFRVQRRRLSGLGVVTERQRTFLDTSWFQTALFSYEHCGVGVDDSADRTRLFDAGASDSGTAGDQVAPSQLLYPATRQTRRSAAFPLTSGARHYMHWRNASSSNVDAQAFLVVGASGDPAGPVRSSQLVVETLRDAVTPTPVRVSQIVVETLRSLTEPAPPHGDVPVPDVVDPVIPDSVQEPTFLLEIDFPSGTRRYSFEGASAKRFYEPAIGRIGPVRRSTALLSPRFQRASSFAEIVDQNGELAKLKEKESFYGSPVRYTFGDAAAGPSAFVRLFTGRLVNYSWDLTRFRFEFRDTTFDRLGAEVPGKLSRVDFPNLPERNEGLLRPKIYGNLSSVGDTDAGAVICYRVDPAVGGSLFRYLVGDHVCQGVDNVYSYGVIMNPADWTVVTDYAGGRAMTFLDFVVDPVDPAKAGQIEVTADVRGKTDDGQTTGNLLENPVSQLLDYLTSFGGVFSSEVVSAAAESRAASEAYKGAAWIGGRGLTHEKVVDGFVSSFLMPFFSDRTGLFRIGLITAADFFDVAAVRKLKDQDDVIRGSFRGLGNREPASSIEYEFKRRWTESDSYALRHEQVNAGEEAALRGPIVAGQSLAYAADENTADRVAAVQLILRRENQQYVQFELPTREFGLDLLEFVTLDHFRGTASDGLGWRQTPFLIEELEIDPRPRGARILCRAARALDEQQHADSHTDVHADTGHADEHQDAGHQDAGHQDEHADTVHQDSAHTDTHSDVAHSDFAHADGAHSDSHGDAEHSDSEHGDNLGHSDSHADGPHADSHSDSPHSDSPHSDAEHTDTPHVDEAPGPEREDDVQHGDIAHSDSPHGDSEHGDIAHQDAAHTDAHSDVAHIDTAHGDAEHEDAPHSDSGHADSSHGDSSHSDGHSDIAHQDAHGDSHSDAGHQDAAHTDAHFDADHQDTLHQDFHADSATAHSDSEEPHADHFDLFEV